MKSAEANTQLINGYLKLLDNLSSGNKLDLIAKLSMSLKSEIPDKKNY